MIFFQGSEPSRAWVLLIKKEGVTLAYEDINPGSPSRDLVRMVFARSRQFDRAALAGF